MPSESVRESPPQSTLVREAFWASVAGIAVFAITATLLSLLGSDSPLAFWTEAAAVLRGQRHWSANYFIVLSGVLLLDAVVLGWHHSALRHLATFSRSARTDMLVAGLHMLGGASLLMVLFSGGVIWGIQHAVAPFYSLNLIAAVGPTWVQILVVFLVVDFLNYWYHRVSHEIEFLWEAHKFHHAATALTVLTGNRVHALEEGFRHVFSIVPLAALGTPPQMYVLVWSVRLAIDMLQHSMIPWTYGWFGRWVFFSPVGHRIHHSALQEHYDQNYGDILVIWDRLFGTWYSGTVVNERVDVTNNPYNERSVGVDYMLCAVRYLRALWTSIRSNKWRTEINAARR